MDAEQLDAMNGVVNEHYQRARQEAGLTFNQYAILVRLHVNQEFPEIENSYWTLKDFVRVTDQSDFKRIIVKPLKEKGYIDTESRGSKKPSDILITEKGSDLVEKVLKL